MSWTKLSSQELEDHAQLLNSNDTNWPGFLVSNADFFAPPLFYSLFFKSTFLVCLIIVAKILKFTSMVGAKNFPAP